MRVNQRIRSAGYAGMFLALLGGPTSVAAQQHRGGAGTRDTAKTSMHCAMSGGVMSGGMMSGDMTSGGRMSGMMGKTEIMSLSSAASHTQVMRLQPEHLILHAEELELSDSQLVQLEAMIDATNELREEHGGGVHVANQLLEKLFETNPPDPDQVRSVAQSAAWHQAELYAQMWDNAAKVRATLSQEQLGRAAALMANMMCGSEVGESAGAGSRQ